MHTLSLPFPRGKTFYNGGTIDTANLQGAHYEGTEYTVDDVDPTDGTRRSYSPVTLRIVRWSQSVYNALPKHRVTFKTGTYYGECDGRCDIGFEGPAATVDEYLAAAGVPNGDLFYVVVEGPGLCVTALEADANNSIAENDILFCLTAVTSGATTAGRVRPLNAGGTFSAAETTDGTSLKAMHNAVGRALSAKTTGQTNGDILVQHFRKL
jgi:hypothetical protein